MINRALREQLSALLDNQLPEDQRRVVEEKIRNHPEVREEWESMRRFAGMISQTAPAPVQAPPDFRSKILDRIKASGASGQGSGSSGAGGATGGAGLATFSKLSWPAYVAAGAVLTGLVGTMVYLDLRTTRTAAKPSTQTEDLNLGAAEPGANPTPAFRGEAAPGVAAGDIQGKSSLSRPAAPQAHGQVFSFGQGQAVKPGGLATAPWEPSQPKTSTEINQESYRASAGLRLESGTGWRREDVARLVPERPADQVMALAQRYHLSPGLLCAAAHDFPAKALEDLAFDLRASLNASVKFPEEARLQKCAKDVGGNEARAGSWKKYLQQP